MNYHLAGKAKVEDLQKVAAKTVDQGNPTTIDPFTRPFTFHVPTNKWHQRVVEYSEIL